MGVRKHTNINFFNKVSIIRLSLSLYGCENHIYNENCIRDSIKNRMQICIRDNL